MKKLMLSFFSLLLFAVAATTATAQPKPKLAVFVVGMDDWKRGDVVAHIVGEELNRDKTYQVVTRSGAVQVKLKQLRRSSVGVKVCELRSWCKAHGIDHLCLITSSDSQNFGAQLLDMNDSQVQLFSGCSLIKGFGAVDLKELAWSLTTQLRSGCPRPCSNYCEASTGMDMVYVKGGTFTIGFLEGRDDADGRTSATNAFPARAGVTVEDFWIGQHEVTRKEWGSNSGWLYRPVMETSWNDVKSHLAKLNANRGVNTCMVYKLPTEAQWEYAARGGVKMYERCAAGCMYSGSNSIDEVANYSSLSEVMHKLPNELGIYDMSGNVWEWLDDRYRTTYDGAPESGSNYPIRGGGHTNDRYGVAARDKHPSSSRHDNIGFRVV
jgi:formylglycine-generating enzyme required for sulfatase activity